MALTRLHHFADGNTGYAAPVEEEFDNLVTYINQCIHRSGSVYMLANLVVSSSTPGVYLSGQEAYGGGWRMTEKVVGTTSYLSFEYYDAPDWIPMATFPLDEAAWSVMKYLQVQYLQLSSDSPYIEMEGTEVSGETFRLAEADGVLAVQAKQPDTSFLNAIEVEADGTVTVPVLDASQSELTVEDLIIASGGSVTIPTDAEFTADKSISLSHLALLSVGTYSRSSLGASFTGTSSWMNTPVGGSNVMLIRPMVLTNIVSISFYLEYGASNQVRVVASGESSGSGAFTLTVTSLSLV